MAAYLSGGCGNRTDQPPTRCSLIDSPTSTQRVLETQLAADKGCANPTIAACLQGWSVGPVKRTTPASAEVTTELPTATQESMVVQDTSMRAAAEMGTGWFDQVAPPLSVVITSPWPVRAPFKVVAVVPTTVQRTPATPVGEVVVVTAVDDVDAAAGAVLAGTPVGAVAVVVVEVKGKAPLPMPGPFRQETPLRYPRPLGTLSLAHVDPPSVVTAMTPATWSTSTEVCAVTQQWWSSEHAMAVAPVTPAGSAPSCSHPELGEVRDQRRHTGGFGPGGEAPAVGPAADAR